MKQYRDDDDDNGIVLDATWHAKTAKAAVRKFDAALAVAKKRLRKLGRLFIKSQAPLTDDSDRTKHGKFRG